ncbi:NADP-dependent oxidoreductase domain-containing protein [Immersiella caudata]|uniref:NADP-dependent oxidoreductase domain-containing protein n=1 Tax=Immersiella caudata TaxID=314043 RepID=A0AA40BUD6_9PEZI|nr:NADP-dependent oxidoreductase domain-containing protein [Immersiella caudata]
MGKWSYRLAKLPGLPAMQSALQAGINFIDTAEAYVNGTSEGIVGDLVKGLPRDNYIGNYLCPADAPVKSLQKSLERLGLDYVDIYLPRVELGLTKTVGVANYDRKDVLEMKAELAKYDIPLAVNQCEFNVLRRYPEISSEGFMKTWRAEGIFFQSYSSLAESITYRFSSYDMEVVEPVLEVLQRIGERRGKRVSSVALNSNISKGALPLVGIGNPEQAKDALEALGWRLTKDQVDKVSTEGKKAVLWQQG